MYVENGIYDINNQPIKATFKYEKEGRLFLGVSQVEIFEGYITGKVFVVFDYTVKQIFTIDSYKK